MRKEFDFELVLEKNPAVPFHGMHNVLRISGNYFLAEEFSYFKWAINVEALRVQNNDTWINIWPYIGQILGAKDLNEDILGLEVMNAIQAHIDYLEQSQTETPLIDAAADGH